MTVSPPSRPILPVLLRMAAGLAVASAGAVVAWQGVTVKPTPGMSTTVTAVSVPLDGPQPLDLAEAANLRLTSDRLNVTVTPLGPGSPEILAGQVKHRVRNPVQLDQERLGRQVNASLTLNVQAINRSGVVVNDPEPVQHTATLQATRLIPLTLSAHTTSGDLTLTLTPMRLRALNLRSGSGNQTVTLPGRASGPFSMVTSSGDVNVSAPPGANPEALRVNTITGDVSLNLGGMTTQALGIGTASGDVRLTLPRSSQRGTVTTGSGDVTVTVQGGTRGNLDIRTQTGNVHLVTPATLKLRVRFTDRDTLTLPAGLPAATAPDLDVFIDAPSDQFSLTTTDGTPVIAPPPPPAPPPPSRYDSTPDNASSSTSSSNDSSP